MIRAKNYETLSKFVKVVPIILSHCGVFFPDTVYIASYSCKFPIVGYVGLRATNYENWSAVLL